MRSKPTPGQKILEVWRAQGADQLDLLRFHYLDALQRRVLDHGGEARRVLENRLSTQVKAYADDVERAARDSGNSDCAQILQTPAHGTLGSLLEAIATQTGARGDRDATGNQTPDQTFPEMAALADIRKLWASMRSESEVRRSLEQSPTNAGPLNSASLVHRSLTLMRELSPGYLQQFMSYVDALSWLEQLNDCGVLAANTANKPGSGKVRTKSKPRKRRD